MFRKQALFVSSFAFAVASCGESQLKPGSHIQSLNKGPGVEVVSASLDDEYNLSFYSSESQEKDSLFINEFSGRVRFEPPTQKIRYFPEEGESVEVGAVTNGKFFLCTDIYDKVCDISFSKRTPADLEDGNRVIYTSQLVLKSFSDEVGSKYTELLKYVSSSPNQEDGGSCLFMSNTGAVELLLNKSQDTTHAMDGTNDLSERFLMNASRSYQLRNWRTDMNEVFNGEGGGLLNTDYRYTKDYYKQNNNVTLRAVYNESGASFGTKANWINDYSETIKSKLKALPQVKTTIIQSDPAGNQWNVGVMNNDVIAQIKHELVTKQSPVELLYNHFGIWHAVVIVGFDDTVDNGNCPFVHQFVRHMKESGGGSASYAKKVENAMATQGECNSKGVFYVRDSIYSGEKSDLYDYNTAYRGEESPYSKAIITHSYEWAKYLGNHAYTIHF